MLRCILLLVIPPLLAQGSLQSVKKIFIEGLGDKPQLQEVKKDLASELRRSDHFTIADSADHADAILTGRGDTWLKGYYSLNPRAGTSPANGEPVYGGYVSVELKDRAGITLWSYLATPHASSRNISKDLSKDVIKHLLASSMGQGRP